MNIYRRLFFNNIQSLLSSNFPVIRKLYNEADWRSLVRDFYSEHRCQTPLFPEVAKEFLRYLQDGRHDKAEDPGFLHELAHYEWVELALSLDEREIADHDASPSGDLLEEIPVLSPLAWPLSYRYPVHRINPEYRPAEPPEDPTHLLVYRDRQDEIKFMQLNQVSRILFQLLQENRSSCGRELLEKVAEAIQHPNPERVIENGSALLESFRSKDVLLGSTKV